MPVAPRETDIFRPGDLLNNTYRIEGVLGRGGISEVYRARSEISNRVCALKVLNKEYAANEAFLVLMTREEEIQDIRHDAIVRYSGCQRTREGHVYLIMDFVDGTALDGRMHPDGVPMRDLMVIGSRIAAGLEAAHGRNIIHRDLSPDNIILRADDPGQAVIIDFGIAKDTSEGAATIVGGKFAGKYAYAAPEQFRGKTDARSDIYSTGALLLAAFRGAEPEVSDYPADVIEYKAKPLDTEGVPQPLKGILDRMVAPDPDARYQSAVELRQAFDAAIEGLTVIKTAVPEPAAARPRRRGLLTALVLLLSAGLGTGFFGWDQGWFLPRVEQFVLRAQAVNGGAPTLTGFAPSGAVQSDLHTLVAARGGAQDLNIARGDLHPDWGTTIANVLDIALELDTFNLAVEDHDIHIDGEADTPTHKESVETQLASARLPEGFTLSSDIILPPGRLFAETVMPVLAERSTCGALAAPNLPPEGLPEGSPLRVAGQIEADGDRLALRDALDGIAGNRALQLDLTELNAALCLLFRVIPAFPESGVEIQYSFGRTGQRNESDRFFAGENAVIELVLPAGVTEGYLYVAYIQANGEVYRLLPTSVRPDNSVAALRGGSEGRVVVPVTRPASAASDVIPTITVQPPAGTDLVLVLHSDQPVLPAPLRSDETVQAFAAAVKGAAEGTNGQILAARSRYFIVQKQ